MINAPLRPGEEPEQEHEVQTEVLGKHNLVWFKKSVEVLPEHSWCNELVNADKEPEEHELQFGSIVMFGKCIKKFLNKDKITKADLKTIPTRYFFNNDLEYLRHGNEEKKYAFLIISVKRIKVVKKYGYRYLDEIVVKRVDKKDYTFLECDFPRLNQNDIKDMYLLKIQDKIHHIDGVDEFDLINALQLYIRRIVIRKRVDDAQLGVKSYQKKLNLTKP
ncbi:hypothetical protein Tco_1320927 [Tanacetum coccineum]